MAHHDIIGGVLEGMEECICFTTTTTEGAMFHMKKWSEKKLPTDTHLVAHRARFALDSITEALLLETILVLLARCSRLIFISIVTIFFLE